jgi:hypothetical protein
VTDLESEKKIATLARNVSLFGCFVTAVNPMDQMLGVKRASQMRGF